MKSSTLILVGLTLCSLYITHASGISPGATGTFSLALVTLTGHLPTVLSGVLTLTSQGIQYLNNEQFAAMQDPYAPGGSGTPGQGLWRDDGNGGGRGGSAPAQDYEDDEDKSEPDQEDEEVEEKEDDDESEEKEIVDDAPVESEEVKEVVKVKAPKKYKTPKKVSKDQIEALKEKEAIQKLKEQSEEVVDDDLEIDADDADAEGEEKRRKQPPMPPVLSQQLMMSQYDAAINGVQPEGANAPLLSRMTSYLSSLLGRGGQSQYGSDQYGSNPYFVNRDAKSIESEDIITESNEPDTSSRTKRDVDVLSRRNRQLKLAELRKPIRIHQ